MNSKRATFAAFLLAILVAAAGALLIATRAWQTVTAPRPRPLADDVLAVSGRTLDASITACALVALAGVIAILATRGIARRIVCLLVALSGVVVAWRAAVGFSAVSQARGRQLVLDKHTGVGLDRARAVHITVHPQWAALTLLCGVVIVLASVVIAVRNDSWSGMSARYEAPGASAERNQARTDASMWSALDHGVDPTTLPPGDGAAPRPG